MSVHGNAGVNQNIAFQRDVQRSVDHLNACFKTLKLSVLAIPILDFQVLHGVWCCKNGAIFLLKISPNFEIWYASKTTPSNRFFFLRSFKSQIDCSIFIIFLKKNNLLICNTVTVAASAGLIPLSVTHL